MKPYLFVNLDGPVLIPSEKPNPALNAGIAGFVKPFINWALEHFNVQWITDRHPRDAFHVNTAINIKSDVVPVRLFDTSKVEILKKYKDFALVDSELIPSEITWLAQQGYGDRFISVDPQYGVGPEHKEALVSLLKSKKISK